MPGETLSPERHAPLAITPDQFQKIGHTLVDRIAEHLRTLPQRPVTPAESAAEVRKQLRAADPLPATGTDPEVLLREAAGLLFQHSLFNGHPRFWGYITSSPAPIGMLGDLLASAANPNCGAWALSPMATEIEIQTVRWIAEFMGYPAQAPGECAGLLVSGGNMANFVCFLAARAAMLGGDVRKHGVNPASASDGATETGRLGPWRVYCSAGTHTWVQKATDLFGLGTDSIRWIPPDKSQRIDVAALRKQLAEDTAQGDRPMMIIGTAGSVATGSVDPLPELAVIAREYGAWFHVDGAYGGLAARVPGVPSDLAGIGEADSIAVDPHKWFYAPLEAGCSLVRNADHLKAAFSYHPTYYHFDEEVTNFFDLGIQNSRGFRALKVWLALRQVGRDGYLEMLGDDIQLAQQLYALVKEHPVLEALTCDLSITTFRYVPADLQARATEPDTAAYLNRLNEGILDRIQNGGEAYLSNAVIPRDGISVYALRACVVNFHTTQADIAALPELVTRLGVEQDGKLRTEPGVPG